MLCWRCNLQKSWGRGSASGVPLVSVLSPLVFLTAGGLSGLSTPNSCWLLARGPHLTQWRQCNIQMDVHDGLRGHYKTEFHCIHVCIYEKLGPLLWRKDGTDVNAFFIGLRTFKTTESVLLFHHKGISAYFFKQSAYWTGSINYMWKQ